MMLGLFSRHTRLVGVLTAALGLAALSGAPAQAALINTDACDHSALTQPFSQFGDAGYYKLVPGGSFESGTAGWTLGGGAHTVAGSEPYAATGTAGSSSLDLPAGASVTSPFTCVNAAYPTFKFFARNHGVLSTVAVSVVYKVPLLGQTALPVGVYALGASWAPSLPMLTASAVTGLLSGGTTQVALRFTALTGNSQIDDVFVDPKMHY